jgi:hypothetical protein
MRGAAVNVKSCVAEAANVSGLAPAAFVLDAASIQNAAAEKAAAEKETDEKDEEKQEKERLQKQKERAEKKEEKERLRKGKAAAEMCGSFDTHYHAPAAAVARRAQQRQPQIAKKENSFLPSLEPQDSLPKKLSESSPFRRAGYSESIPLKANLEIPATKANLESPAIHQSQNNSIAKESFEQASVIAPLAHATSTTDVNLEIQATHRSQTNSIEEIANFGVAETKIAPVARIDSPTSGKAPYRLPSTVKADLLCGNEPFEHVKKNKDTEGKSRYELQVADDALLHALHHTRRESARLFLMAVTQIDPDNHVLGISRTLAAERKGSEGDADNCRKRGTYTLENVLAAGNSAHRYAEPSNGGFTITKVQY